MRFFLDTKKEARRSVPFCCLLAGTFCLLLDTPVRAVDDGGDPSPASTFTLGEVVVNAARDKANKAEEEPVTEGSSVLVVTPEERARTSDTAGLLSDVPGASLQTNGGVSTLPFLHGLGDDRLRIKVDGMDLISACPNHMNSPLSYIDPSNVGTMEAVAGITPVSMGGDSIGGTIVVKSPGPEFAEPGAGTLYKGEAGGFYRSNGDGRGGIFPPPRPPNRSASAMPAPWRNPTTTTRRRTSRQPGRRRSIRDGWTAMRSALRRISPGTMPRPSAGARISICFSSISVCRRSRMRASPTSAWI